MHAIEPRRRLLQQLANRAMTAVARRGAGTRIGLDGVDGAGKSTFAGELASTLRSTGTPVVQICADDFHRPRAERHRRGRTSPEGFWLDSYDHTALAGLLDAFGPGGSRRYREGVHDLISDRPLDVVWRSAPPDAVLVVDGLFLHRDEFAARWDFSIFLQVPFQVSTARMAVRDGTPADPDHPANARYVGGQRLYFDACSPWRRADVVVDNTDLALPRIVHPVTSEV